MILELIIALSVVSLAPRCFAATEKVVYSFKGQTDGESPAGGLLYLNGVFYGTTIYGGGSGQHGTVFSLTPSGHEKVLYTFQGGSDGSNPYSTLIAVNGVLYGTTYNGGSGQCSGGCGTVFSVTTSGAEQVLYAFQGGADGINPTAGLTETSGAFYGTTYNGGANGYGTVFQLSAAGSETIVHSFTGDDGGHPYAALTLAGGVLYGTSTYGTRGGFNGSVFAVTPPGGFATINLFANGKTDGYGPFGGVLDINGALYGTDQGGKYNNGVIYELVPGSKEQPLYQFPKTGKFTDLFDAPFSEIGDTLYSTSQGVVAEGGSCGFVFSSSLTGTASIIYTFPKSEKFGCRPLFAALLDVGGVLYGTAEFGGAHGFGVVYSITP